MNLFYAIYSAMCLTSKIKYMQYPVCKDCAHFLPNKDRTDEFGKCRLFGDKNIVTGETKYNYADLSRLNNDLCNITGKYFEPL